MAGRPKLLAAQFRGFQWVMEKQDCDYGVERNEVLLCTTVWKGMRVGELADALVEDAMGTEFGDRRKELIVMKYKQHEIRAAINAAIGPKHYSPRILVERIFALNYEVGNEPIIYYILAWERR